MAKGKPAIPALVAVMRKILHAIYEMFKHRQTYDGSKVFALQANGSAVAPVETLVVTT